MHQELYLTDAELQFWTNNILLSALYQICLFIIVLYHLYFWAETLFKVKTKSQYFSTDYYAQLQLKYDISHVCLTEFWNTVQNHIQQRAAENSINLVYFCDCFLVISSHNFKLTFSNINQMTAQQYFWHNFTIFFNSDSALLLKCSCWINLSIKLSLKLTV